MKIISNIRSDTVSFGAGRILFVEGKDDSFDVRVLRQILPIEVKPLGASFALKGAAEAFAAVCPTYFFVIDRDHVDDDEVERHWQNFPKADTPNLLIWRKKELENYFLDPSFLMQSEWFDSRRSADDLKKIILRSARRIIYMAAANLVIEKVRETLKRKWIEQFTCENEFPNAEVAKGLLLSRNEFSDQKMRFSDTVRPDAIGRSFDETLRILTGGHEPLEWGCGRWLDLLPAKDMLNAVVQSSCFRVKGKRSNCLTGEEKKQAIIESLVRQGNRLPDDFTKLCEILNTRTKSVEGRLK